MPNEEVRRSVALPRDDVSWFEQTYGEGKLSWVLSMVLTEFRKVHTLHPQDYAEIAARQLHSKIEKS